MQIVIIVNDYTVSNEETNISLSVKPNINTNTTIVQALKDFRYKHMQVRLILNKNTNTIIQ